jgi:hypothetical protein
MKIAVRHACKSVGVRTTPHGICVRSSRLIVRKITRQPRFERGTYGLEGRCSIHLSYWRALRISYLVKRISSKAILTPATRDPSIKIRDTFFRVGVRGFEPPTPCAQGRCATRLRYTPLKYHLSRVCCGPPQSVPRREIQSEKRHTQVPKPFCQIKILTCWGVANAPLLRPPAGVQERP